MLATSIQLQLETDIHLHIFFWIIFTTIHHFVIIFKNLLLNWIAEWWSTLLAFIKLPLDADKVSESRTAARAKGGFSEKVYKSYSLPHPHEDSGWPPPWTSFYLSIRGIEAPIWIWTFFATYGFSKEANKEDIGKMTWEMDHYGTMYQEMVLTMWFQIYILWGGVIGC